MNKTKDKSTNWKITEGKSKEYFMSQFNTGPHKIFFQKGKFLNYNLTCEM